MRESIDKNAHKQISLSSFMCYGTPSWVTYVTALTIMILRYGICKVSCDVHIRRNICLRAAPFIPTFCQLRLPRGEVAVVGEEGWFGKGKRWDGLVRVPLYEIWTQPLETDEVNLQIIQWSKITSLTLHLQNLVESIKTSSQSTQVL